MWELVQHFCDSGFRAACVWPSEAAPMLPIVPSIIPSGPRLRVASKIHAALTSGHSAKTHKARQRAGYHRDIILEQRQTAPLCSMFLIQPSLQFSYKNECRKYMQCSESLSNMTKETNKDKYVQYNDRMKVLVLERLSAPIKSARPMATGS